MVSLHPDAKADLVSFLDCDLHSCSAVPGERLESRRSLTFTCETEYPKLPPAEAMTVCTQKPLPPVKAMFVELRLICQSTFLLSRDRRSGGLSDCPSGVITFTTTHCSAAPQTPGQLPQALPFPLEKKNRMWRWQLQSDMIFFFNFWRKSEKNPSLCLTICTLGLDRGLCTRTRPLLH